ncbi:probable disease resistance protein At5g66900 [Juglans microcarpa x Juglans regia]|uniref:probable disease resistance protein At5g66900 n=1 Tax=Juglans microcarpa x Juglans regia TaxID=2249226 RepID=UPI001B7DF0DD|nr:probable disease resistance protein At5g66900 [Juglans microcarpa x Juglans regia]
MALAFVGSAALGAAFGEAFAVLYSTVKDVITKTLAFKSILQQLKSTLDVLDPLVKDIQQSNRELGRSEKETHDLIQQMKKGEKLVSKYSNLTGWKHFVRYHYANKLRSLDEALCRFFQIHIPAWGLRNGIEVLRGVNHLCAQMNSAGINGVLPCAVPEPPDFTVGLDVSLKELKMELLKKEVLMLVLTAPGGCGKTTLVKMLCQDEDIKGKYEIFFVIVTKTPNLKDIIRRIFRHKGDRAPEFQSDEDAINHLKQLLNRITQQNPILLILDDVWSGSESLLEMFKFHMTSYKILVTSRTAFPRFSCKYKLEPLSDEDATKLFRHSAILQDGNSYIPDDDTVRKIVKFCGGFPLALEVIGSSLRGESAATWENRMQNWTSGDSILDSVPEIDLLERLQSSLEFSDKKVKPKYEVIMKECFMDIGSFPEDQRIRVASLIDMWEELYELDEVGTIANLLEISSRNLASLVVTRRDASEVGRYYAEDFVLQHDLLRELAIHQCRQEPVEKRKKLIMDISGNNLPKWWTEQKQQHISSHLLSISTDENFSSNWCKIQPPEVKVLVLNFQTENYTLPEFVEKMEELKVLIVTNYGSFPVELGNFQLLGSVPNLKRIRLEKVSIPSICKTLSASRSLEKISLFMCHIGHAFRNCSIQISDALPNLREINIDYCIELVELPAGIFDIISLKKLNITNCHKLSTLPEGLGKLRNLEVLRLRSCTKLLELPESSRSLHNLVVLDISDCLSIIKLPKHIGELCNLKEFHMKGCLALRNQLLLSILDLKHLKLVVCDEERAKRWEPIMELRADCSRPQIKVAEKDDNLKWLGNRF